MQNKSLVQQRSRLPWRTALILFSIIFSPGCATTDSGKTKTEGTLLGAAAGTVVGYLIGDSAGAAVGAAIGGIVGYAYGSHVAGKKAQFASQEEYLNAVIAQAQSVIKESKKYNEDLQQQIAQLNTDQVELKNATLVASVETQALENFTEKIHVSTTNTETKLELVKQEIEIQNSVIISEQDTASPNLINVAFENVSELENQQKILEASLLQLKVLDERRAY